MRDTATQSADADGGNILSYKVRHSCYGYTGSHYEISVLFNNVVIGCIYYLEDPFISCEPTVNFDKWRKYKLYENQIPTFDPLKAAQDTLLEYYLLEQNRITIR